MLSIQINRFRSKSIFAFNPYKGVEWCAGVEWVWVESEGWGSLVDSIFTIIYHLLLLLTCNLKNSFVLSFVHALAVDVMRL